MSNYIAGIDWGLGNGPTEIAVINSETKQIEGYRIVKNDNLQSLVEVVMQLNEEWKPTQIWGEALGIGSAIVQELMMFPLPIRPFVTTAKSKAEMMAALKHSLELGELKPASPRGIELFQGDNESVALALAWYGVRQSAIQVDFS